MVPSSVAGFILEDLSGGLRIPTGRGEPREPPDGEVCAQPLEPFGDASLPVSRNALGVSAPSGCHRAKQAS